MSRKKGSTGKRVAAIWSTVFVADLQVRYCSGTITLVVNDHHAGSEPVAVVIPGESALGFLGNLRDAVADAEEWYWPQFAPWLGAVARKHNGDAMAIFDEIERWHRTEGWEKVIRTAHRRGASGLALLTHVGHIALLAFQPFSRRPVVLVFDPTQLRRVSGSLHTVSARAADTADPARWEDQVEEAHRGVEVGPAPDLSCLVQPTAAEAAERQRSIYEDFLRRSPYTRPEHHDLLPDEQS